MIAVVAYPRLDVADFRAVEAIRTALDPQARRIAAHVTLVFPVDLPPAEVSPICAAVAGSSRPIPFVIRKAMARTEPNSAGGRVFYVAEEGHEAISALHRRLYDSPLKAHLWPEPPYVPHITLAVDPEWARCEALAERLTVGARPMSGWIDSISLIEVKDPRVVTIAEWAVGTSLTIVPFEDKYQDAFARLNKAWLNEHGLFEEADRAHLEKPRQSILATGGQIFVAVDKGAVVGVCATIVQDADTIEFAKFAVAPEARGRGIGRQLTAAALAWARDKGARKVMLLSSRKLDAALRLYERSGFIYGPLPAHVPYSSADVYMELTL
jgi:GNAT superfamily N-acetyltransferase/2'-5' RNA ligase